MFLGKYVMLVANKIREASQLSKRQTTKKKSKRVRNIFINIVLVCVLLVGLALVFNNQIKNFLIERNSDQYSVSEVSKKTVKKNEKAKASFDYDQVESVSSEAVIKAQLANKKLPVIGGVAVPSVSINLPIFKGVSNEALLWGAGTLSENQKMGAGNYALASHRTLDDTLLFSPLEKLEVGAIVYVTDLTNIYTYKTTMKIKVAPTDVQYLDEVAGKKILTLITCGDMNATTRIIIQGDLQKVTPMKKATKAMTAAFEMAQKTL